MSDDYVPRSPILPTVPTYVAASEDASEVVLATMKSNYAAFIAGGAKEASFAAAAAL